MQVKIDTREKYYVITLLESNLSANMTDELQSRLLRYLQKEVKSIVLNMQQIEVIDVAAAEELISIQQGFYEGNASFVICCLQADVEKALDESGLLELMNVVPTDSEAGDIVQMEEIERELLGDEPLS